MRQTPEQTDHLNMVGVFLLLMFAGDAFFIGIHLVHVSSSTFLQDTLYSIETDGGFSEWFQYLKEGWIALLCFALWRRTGNVFLVGWALLFGYFLLDDSMQIHEAGGESISRHLHFPSLFGLRPQDLGELAVSGIMGMIFLLTIGLTYFTAPRNDKSISQDFAFLVGALVTFGVGVDTLHSFVVGNTTSKLDRVALGLLEDGGEMIVMSTICWYALDLLARRGNAAEHRVWRRVPRLFNVAAWSRGDWAMPQ